MKPNTSRSLITGHQVLFVLLSGLLALSPLRAQSTQPVAAGPEKPAAAEPKQEVIRLEAFEVTGTNIKRIEMENVMPVTIIGTDFVEARSALTPAELLASMPIATLAANEGTAGVSGPRGDIGTINLRGLGARASLILLNGRRLPVHPTASAGSPNTAAVNVNTLPTQGLDRVEVLRDGASSIYGSDAMSGVINYITSSDTRGLEIRTRVSWPELRGGQSSETSLTYGLDFAGGRGRFLTTNDYVWRKIIMLRDRPYSAYADHSDVAPPPFNVKASAFDGRSTTSFWPQFRVGTSTTTTYFRPVNGVPTFTTAAPSRSAADPGVTGRPDTGFFVSTNPYVSAWPGANRVNSFNSLEYELKGGTTAFGEVSFYRSTSAFQRVPINLNVPAADEPQVLPIDSPFNPYGSRFYSVTGAPNADGTPRLTGTPQTVSVQNQIVRDIPPDHSVVTSEQYRILAGLRGKFSGSRLNIDWNKWTWESAATFSRMGVKDQGMGQVRESLLQNAYNRVNNPNLPGYNPFGYTFKVVGNAVVADQPYTNPDVVGDSFTDSFWRSGRSFLWTIDARASGPVAKIWSGDISMAAGAEWRREWWTDMFAPYYGYLPAASGLDPNKGGGNDFVAHLKKPDQTGDRQVYSAYAETVIPLVSPAKEIPLLQSLELSASARYERFSDFGSTTKPKVGLNWKPSKSVMVRASYNEGFAAPPLAALWSKPDVSFLPAPGTVDPYRNTATNEGPYVQINRAGGNPDLKPEESRGRTAGIVVQVPWVKGLSFAVDYWDISMFNVIGTRSGVVEVDQAILMDFTQAELAKGVPINSINAGSGTSNYKGDFNMIRYAPTPEDIAAFAAYNARVAPALQEAVVGRIAFIDTPLLNLASKYTSGWDMGVNYTMPILPIVGVVTLNTEWAYQRRAFTIQNMPGAAPETSENIGGNGRWRGNATLSMRNGLWSGGVSAFYTPTFTTASTTESVYNSLGKPPYLSRVYSQGRYQYSYIVHDTTSYNAFISYSFSSNTNRWLRFASARLGVINLTDLNPPLSSTNYGFNTAANIGLLPGRTWTLELSKKF